MELTDVQNKESDIGFIPHDWEVKRIDEIAIVDPESLSNSSTNPDYTFKYISLEDVDYGVLKNYTELKFSNAPSRARRIVKRNDILFSTVRPNLKSHLHITSNVYDLICSTGFSVIRCNENACGGYVFNHLFASIINSQVNNLITGSNYPAINSKEVRSLKIPFPREKSEQTAIATALSDTDALIEGLEKLIAKKRNIKQGAMQELFSPKENWQLSSLGDIIEVLTDYTANGSFESLKNNVKYYETKNYAVLVRTTDLDKVYFEPQRFTDKKGYDFLSKTALFGGEIIIANVGSIGKVFRVPFFDMPMTLAPNTYLLRFEKGIDENYIYQWLLTNEFYVKLMSKIGSSTLQAINKDNLRDIELYLPSDKGEQKDIASILSDMDKDIKDSIQKLDKYRLIKQGMMQVLLTGKIRLL